MENTQITLYEVTYTAHTYGMDMDDVHYYTEEEFYQIVKEQLDQFTDWLLCVRDACISILDTMKLNPANHNYFDLTFNAPHVGRLDEYFMSYYDGKNTLEYIRDHGFYMFEIQLGIVNKDVNTILQHIEDRTIPVSSVLNTKNIRIIHTTPEVLKQINEKKG